MIGDNSKKRAVLKEQLMKKQLLFMKEYRAIFVAIIDILLIFTSYIIATYFRYSDGMTIGHVTNVAKHMPWTIPIYIVSFEFFKLYESLWTVASMEEFLYGVNGNLVATTVVFAIQSVLNNRLSLLVVLLSGIFITLNTIGMRLCFRIYRRYVIAKSRRGNGAERVLIIGAGYAAQSLIREMKISSSAYNIIGLIDDDKVKIGKSMSGVKIVGDRTAITDVVEKEKVDLIVVAINRISSEERMEILNICKLTSAKTKVLPNVIESINSDASLSQIRDVKLEDLLGREPVMLNEVKIKEYIRGKRVLVTGGGGSIGSELCRQIVKFNPSELMILDIYENNAYDLQQELIRKYPELKLKVFIASIRDKVRLEKIFKEHSPQIVYHAAAHKHVPLMEFNPSEAIKNNVFGTLNLSEVSDKYKVEKFVQISTDKAVNPTNIMGASKRLCEMVIQAMDRASDTSFVAVRFGNVLGSNGSVIPLFKKQIAAGGPVTVTNKYITRYFMLIPEAAQLVLQAGAFAKGGEIFVLDMGKPVKIYDLAQDLIRLSGLVPHKDIEIKVTGLRPGEKLFEELLMAEEGLERTEHEKIFIGKPSEFNIDTLRVNLDKLRVGLNNEENIKDIVAELVPTYLRKSEEEQVAVGEV